MPDSEVLFIEYRSRLFRYLARASGSADTAQDLTQNVAVDHHRRHGRTPALITLDTNPAAAPSQEISTALDQALARLDEMDRHVFLMREVGGLSYEEIGQACDLSPDAVRSRIYRSRLQLRETLSADIATARKRPIRHSGAPT